MVISGKLFRNFANTGLAKLISSCYFAPFQVAATKPHEEINFDKQKCSQSCLRCFNMSIALAVHTNHVKPGAAPDPTTGVNNRQPRKKCTTKPWIYYFDSASPHTASSKPSAPHARVKGMDISRCPFTTNYSLLINIWPSFYLSI